ncbi:MAG: Yip1 family protein [Gammaproteobacteria bacterium]|nr:Yip1 family protein [Gammaproteobacteria bacterium]
MINLMHIPGLIFQPQKEWQKISQENNQIPGLLLGYVLILALIGPVAGYYGTTTSGWQIGTREAVKLTPDSAMTIAVLYYFAMVISVIGLGFMVRWMCKTYGGNTSLNRCIALSAYVSTPLFLVGIVELYPVLWVNLLIGLFALAHAIYLLYSGVPILMNISEDKGFLMSSALLALGMVALVTLLALTALLWGFGIQPQFTD